MTGGASLPFDDWLIPCSSAFPGLFVQLAVLVAPATASNRSAALRLTSSLKGPPPARDAVRSL
ncbi:hypothetical protein MFU01_55210 [Myxococcus fulvus]|uniref:Uncharacterized protein n=1 Tax=Myxococcus fulvus TaxID=33 RepID=A0A511T8J0_MYXFU|nr:hypothetical protein MFU01_55210 [Myxococcus fulvus]